MIPHFRLSLPAFICAALLVPPSLAATGAALETCEIGATVMSPGHAVPGVIEADHGGMCEIHLQSGDITVMPAYALTRAEGVDLPRGPAAPTEGFDALVEGYWACANSAGEGFDILIAPGSYDMMDGSGGTMAATPDDPLGVLFSGGPWDGRHAVVSNAMLMITPPEGLALTCKLKP